MSDDEEIVREGTCVRDVAAQDFIAALAKYLKRGELVTPPDYTSFTKTAVYKESSPLDNDWFKDAYLSNGAAKFSDDLLASFSTPRPELQQPPRQ